MFSPQQNTWLNDPRGFWAYLDRLVTECQVVIDRPKGFAHPHYPDLIYPLDYGYLEGTSTVDGGEIDVWVGTLEVKSLDALVMTVDLKKRDVELKLLLGCTETEKGVVLNFLNSGEPVRLGMRAQMVRRGDGHGLLRSRRSVRRFLPRSVPDDVMERILEAATWAPSAHNRQPWRFVVLESEIARGRLADAMGANYRCDLLSDGLSPEDADRHVARSRQRLLDAPAAILICLDVSVGDVYPDAFRQEAEHLMGVQGVAMAGGILLLEAHNVGLGGVWTCAPLFAPEAARKSLDLPDEWQPQGLILLGYPAEIPPPRPRRPVSEVARFL